MHIMLYVCSLCMCSYSTCTLYVLLLFVQCARLYTCTRTQRRRRAVLSQLFQAVGNDDANRFWEWEAGDDDRIDSDADM